MSSGKKRWRWYWQDSDVVIDDKSVELGFVLDQTLGCCFFPQCPGHFSQERSDSRKLAVACLPNCSGHETDPPIRIKASGLKIGLLFAGQDRGAAAKGAIDIGPGSTQSIEDGAAPVLVRDVETSFISLKTGCQIRHSRRNCSSWVS